MRGVPFRRRERRENRNNLSTDENRIRFAIRSGLASMDRGTAFKVTSRSHSSRRPRLSEITKAGLAMAKRKRNESKHWFMKFDVGAWLKDPAISSCSEATRGIWFDLLCAMFELDQCGKLSNSFEVVARLGRTSVPKLRKALAELVALNAADVTLCNSNVTIINRKMRREFQVRKATRLRVAKMRKNKNGNAHVTETLEIRGNKLDIRNKISKNPSSRRGASRRSPTGNGSGVRTDITAEVLADPVRLYQWFEEESRRSDGWISDSEADLVNVNAAASKARTAKFVRDPVALFKWIVRGRRWDFLRCSDDDLASQVMSTAKTAADAVDLSEFIDAASLRVPSQYGPITPEQLRKQIESASRR